MFKFTKTSLIILAVCTAGLLATTVIECMMRRNDLISDAEAAKEWLRNLADDTPNLGDSTNSKFN